jgi:hypothetical protein
MEKYDYNIVAKEGSDKDENFEDLTKQLLHINHPGERIKILVKMEGRAEHIHELEKLDAYLDSDNPLKKRVKVKLENLKKQKELEKELPEERAA